MKKMVLLMIFATALTLLTARVTAERIIPVSKNVAMSVTRSLPLDDRPKAGPVLCVTLTNRSENLLSLESPWKMVNFKVTATRDGVQLPCLLKVPDLAFGVVSHFEIAPNESQIVTLDASKWFDVSISGTYSVFVEFYLTYGNRPSSPDRLVPDERAIAQGSFKI